MPKGSRITVKGIDDINKILTTIAPNHAKNLSRSAVHAVASDIAKDAKKRAPKDSGNLRKSIKAKRRKSPPFSPRSEVFVQGGKGGAWYWKFVEFGTLKKSQRPFFLPVYNSFKTNIQRIYTQKFVDKLLKKIESAKKK